MKILALLLVSFNLFALDFELSKTIQSDSDASGYTLELTEDVYRHVKNKQLRDIRIFNADNEAVPMRLIRKNDTINKQISHTTLPVFTLNQTRLINTSTKQVRITQSGTHEDYRITTSDSLIKYLGAMEFQPNNIFYIDASSIKQDIYQFELKWKFETPGNRIFYINIEASNNLSDWTPIVNHHKLVDIHIATQRLIENTIKLKKTNHSYYKLTFSDTPEIQIEQITAQLINTSVSRNNNNLFFTGFPANNNNEVTINTEGFFPVEEITINTGTNNFMSAVKIYSKNNNKGKWKLRTQGSIYALSYESQNYRKNTFKVSGISDPLWKFEFDDKGNSNYINDIRLNWRPNQIQFIAQGQAPYTLYAGNPKLKKIADSKWFYNLPPELQENLFHSRAYLLENSVISDSANEAGKFEATNSSDYKKWMFWSLLGLIMLFLIRASVKLLKEEN